MAITAIIHLYPFNSHMWSDNQSPINVRYNINQPLDTMLTSLQCNAWGPSNQSQRHVLSHGETMAYHSRVCKNPQHWVLLVTMAAFNGSEKKVGLGKVCVFQPVVA